MEIILRELPNPGGNEEKPNIKKLILALLHDVQESFPEYADVVRKIYGDYIADGVNELSKKDWRLYLTEEEKMLCKKDLSEQKKLFHEVRHTLIHQHADMAFTSADKISEDEIIDAMEEKQLRRHKILEARIKPFMDVCKKRRDHDYFGHLDELNDDCLDVKFADRIHNLRDNS
jgi:(p)ppGpp synthase/HD superfamily hydrolase